MLWLSFLCVGGAGWKEAVGVGATGECLSPLFVSKLKALTLYVSFAASSSSPPSLGPSPEGLLCPAGSTPSPAKVCVMPGKVMASKLARFSLSLACQSVLPAS